MNFVAEVFAGIAAGFAFWCGYSARGGNRPIVFLCLAGYVAALLVAAVLR